MFLKLHYQELVMNNKASLLSILEVINEIDKAFFAFFANLFEVPRKLEIKNLTFRGVFLNFIIKLTIQTRYKCLNNLNFYLFMEEDETHK